MENEFRINKINAKEEVEFHNAIKTQLVETRKLTLNKNNAS